MTQINKITNRRKDITTNIRNTKDPERPLGTITHQQPGSLEEMGVSLHTYNLPRLSHKETEKLNRLISTNKIEAIIKKLPINKSLEPDGFTGEFYLTLKELTPILLEQF